MPSLFEAIGSMIKAAPTDAIERKLLPLVRTGNPLLDAGVKFAARAYLNSGRAPENAATTDPKTGVTAAEFWHALLRQESGLLFINGPRGSGKSALSCLIAQEMGRPTFILNSPVHLPWMKNITPKQLDAVPAGSVVIVDDAGQIASSRDYNSKVANQVINIAIEARHEDLTVIANTTASSLVNKYLLQANAIFLKRPDDMAEFIERQGFNRLLRLVEQEYDALGLSPEAEKGYVYVRSTPYRFRGMLAYPLPNNYSSKISKNKAGRRPPKGGITIDNRSGVILDDEDEDDED